MSSVTIYERNGVSAVWNKNAPYTVEGYLMKTRSFWKGDAGEAKAKAIKTAKRLSTDRQLAQRICLHWVNRLGLGFHPDTKGADYRPWLSYGAREDYDRDMDILAGLAVDQYAVGLWAMNRRGLIGEQRRNNQIGEENTNV